MIDDSLTELVRRDLVKELEEEQFLNIAAAILAEACASWGIEYSELDLLTALPAIRATSPGKILDIDLNRLSRFCKNLSGVLPLGGASQVKARLVVMISDELTRQSNVLARVPLTDRTARNERLLRRVFRIEQYVDR